MGRIKNNNQPVIYEDGEQTRDFISVHDIVQANMLSMDQRAADYQVFNVGTGRPISIKGVAQILAKVYGSEIQPKVTNKYRKGDVRHCYADISKIQSKLDFKPKVNYEQGIKEFIDWSRAAESVDRFDKATKELKDKGLV